MHCIWELMDAVDTWIKTPDRKADLPFLMPIEDVFTITGRGTVATGRVERGTVKVGDKVEIVGLEDDTKEIRRHRHRDVPQDPGVRRGWRQRRLPAARHHQEGSRARPGSRCSEVHSSPCAKFKGQVYVLSKEEGGRHTPFFNNYRPQFYFRTTDVTGVITLPEGVEMVHARRQHRHGRSTLITPIAIENGLRFAIREGGRTVGSGVVIGINE